MDKTAWPTGVRPSGKGIRIFLYRKGKLIYAETLKGNPHDARDLRAAVKYRAELKKRMDLGLPLFDGDQAAHKLFIEVAQGYADTLDAKRSTKGCYKQILNRYWVPYLGAMPVSSITTAKIKEVLAGFDVSQKTKKNMLGPLRGVFGHAGTNPNPVEGIKFRKRQKEPVDRYTPRQRDKLLSKLSSQERVYFSVLFGCGLRPGEALGLLWSDYDGEELSVSKQITRRRLEPSTKTSMRRKVYVPTWVRQELNNHPTRFKEKHIFLNGQDGPHLDTDVFNLAWRKAHDKARIPYRIPYVCRHTRAAELLSTGINPAEAAKQLGHSSEMFLRIYAEWIDEYADGDKSRLEGVGTNNLPTTIKTKEGGK